MVHILPTTSNATAKDVARLFIRHIIRHHGIPQNIVSDRDTKFISNFWRAITSTLNIQLKMSSADHPETDGQSEHTNRTVIEMLRSFVNVRNTDWVEHLPIVEICINNLSNHQLAFHHLC